MPAETTATPPRHLPYLDAARGIAALMVLFGHYIGWKYKDMPVVKVAYFAFNATDAVSFFFVLSGMVLTYQYVVLGREMDIRTYYINRVFRLFPAFFLTVLLNALYTLRYEPSLWHLAQQFLYDKQGFWEEALLIKSHVNYFVPGWTLTLELAISFFIPFLLVIGKANRQLLWWLIAASIVLYRVTDPFVFHFTLGCIISFYYHELSAPAMQDRKWYRYRYLILAGAVVLFSLRRIQAFFPAGDRADYWSSYFQINLFHYSAVAAFIFIVLMMRSPRTQRFLSHRIFLFLGKISYGIYLMHWLIVCMIYDHWAKLVAPFPTPTIAYIAWMIICFLVTLVLATALHYWVELPFIRLGKRIAARYRLSVVIA